MREPASADALHQMTHASLVVLDEPALELRPLDGTALSQALDERGAVEKLGPLRPSLFELGKNLRVLAGHERPQVLGYASRERIALASEERGPQHPLYVAIVSAVFEGRLERDLTRWYDDAIAVTSSSSSSQEAGVSRGILEASG